MPTIFKLTDSNITIDKRLDEKGYKILDETSVRIIDLGQFKYCRPGNVVIQDHFTDGWINSFFECSDLEDERAKLTARKILVNIIGRVICVTAQMDGKVVGCGFGAVERGCVGIFDIIVDQNYRRNRYGLSIMNGILGEAFKLGIKTAYLSVVAGNTPAENLYSKLGFKEAYRYWYRKQSK